TTGSMLTYIVQNDYTGLGIARNTEGRYIPLYYSNLKDDNVGSISGLNTYYPGSGDFVRRPMVRVNLGTFPVTPGTRSLSFDLISEYYSSTGNIYPLATVKR